MGSTSQATRLVSLRVTIHERVRELTEPAIVRQVNDEGEEKGYVRLPSLLSQLRIAIRTKVSKIQGSSGFTAKLPLHVDALDLYAEIQREWGLSPETMIRGVANECDGWDDEKLLTRQAMGLTALREAIGNVLDPPRRFGLRDGQGRAAACPECGNRMAARADDMWTPALVLDPRTGCVCLSCGAAWPVDGLERLASVLAPGEGSQPFCDAVTDGGSK